MITEPLTAKQTKRWITGYQLAGVAEFAEAVEQAQGVPFSVTLPSARGLSIFPFRFNRTGDLEFTSSAAVALQRNDVGMVSAVVTETRPRESLTGTVLMQSRGDIATLEAFFQQTMGRAGRFWAASDQPDFFVAGQNEARTTLTVAAFGYTAGDFPNTARRMVLVRDWTNSAWHARLVTASADNGDGTETLTLEAALPAALDSTALVSLLYLVRSELDELAVTFDNQQLAHSDVSFTELPSEIDALLYSDAPADTTPIVAPADGAISGGVLTP